MFRDRLRQVLTLLGISAADFARFLHCDKSHVSRMLSGARVPQNGGAGAQRLVNGIYLCADEKGLVEPLCALVSCESRDSAAAIRAQVTAWLYAGEVPAARKITASSGRIPFRQFGEKLGAVMDLAELSNIRLGRSLNVDPSYISRFRSGFRSPKSNPQMMREICRLLLNRIADQQKAPALARLLGVPGGKLGSREAAYNLLYEWLFETDSSTQTPLVERLIDRIGSFSAGTAKLPLSFAEAADRESLADTASTYYGTAGLQRAVIRFLGHVILRKEKELLLYSDQKMDWMVADPRFRAKWTTLMMLCVRGGTRIRIIHNVNRDLDEMIQAIESWLPLYPLGMIQSYYNKAPGSSAFSTTLFLCPGYACISGTNLTGTEDGQGMYRYDTEPAQLSAHVAFYQEFLARLATMPEETLRSALERTQADQETKERLLRMRKERFQVLERDAEAGFLHEYIPLPSDEALFAEAVPMDITELSLTYTPEEYAAHIRRIMELTEAHADYRFFILPEVPFDHIKLLISADAVAAERLKAPHITILFEHPDLCRAFVAYAERIKERYRQDRLTTQKQLERFL